MCCILAKDFALGKGPANYSPQAKSVLHFFLSNVYWDTALSVYELSVAALLSSGRVEQFDKVSYLIKAKTVTLWSFTERKKSLLIPALNYPYSWAQAEKADNSSEIVAVHFAK